MKLRTYVSEVGSHLNECLPNLHQEYPLYGYTPPEEDEFWMLWVELQHPVEDVNYRDLLETSISSLPNYCGIIWSTTVAGNDNLKSKRSPKKHPFREGTLLSKDKLTSSIIEYHFDVSDVFPFREIYLDVGWIKPPSYEEVAEFLINSSYGFDLAIAIIPDDIKRAWEWANVVDGLGWRFLTRHKPTYTRKPVFYNEEILSIYIRMTVDMYGIAITPYSDFDGYSGYIFFGSKANVMSISDGFAPYVQGSIIENYNDIEHYIQRRAIVIR